MVERGGPRLEVDAIRVQLREKLAPLEPRPSHRVQESRARRMHGIRMPGEKIGVPPERIGRTSGHAVAFRETEQDLVRSYSLLSGQRLVFLRRRLVLSAVEKTVRHRHPVGWQYRYR